MFRVEGYFGFKRLGLRGFDPRFTVCGYVWLTMLYLGTMVGGCRTWGPAGKHKLTIFIPNILDPKP